MKFNDNLFIELGKSQGVEDLTREAAREVAAIARATAPVDTGAYRDGITVVRRETPYRVIFLVVGEDWKTMLIEAKTGNLSRALRSAASG